MRRDEEDIGVPAPGQDPKQGTAAFSSAVQAALARLLPSWPDARLCVALSGGVDSVALLAACVDLKAMYPALSLRALHVHHGLQPVADDWQSRCEALCERLGVPLDVLQLRLAPRRGASVEAEARDARYAALAARLSPGEALLTAHHEDDQLETVLLQLMRGAGVAGLAAMPAAAPLGYGLHLRPLLGVSRPAIEGYARARGLEWVEDPMNASLRFDRGYLRAQIAPAIRARWPAAGRTVARSAGHLAEAQGLLDELAALDAAGALEGECLLASALQALPRARQANLLRWWLRGRGLGAPSSARLSSILEEVLPARVDATPVVTWAKGEVRRYRGRLYSMKPLGPPPPPGWERPMRPGERIELPCGLGVVWLEPRTGPGLSFGSLQGPLSIRFRQGGERLLPLGRGNRHGLGELCRESGVAPWLRARLPLLASGARLLAVGELWVDQGVVDPRAGWRLRWQR
jgi:tRNA(Ile)-lysidine synthase